MGFPGIITPVPCTTDKVKLKTTKEIINIMRDKRVCRLEVPSSSVPCPEVHRYFPSEQPSSQVLPCTDLSDKVLICCSTYQVKWLPTLYFVHGLYIFQCMCLYYSLDDVYKQKSYVREKHAFNASIENQTISPNVLYLYCFFLLGVIKLFTRLYH